MSDLFPYQQHQADYPQGDFSLPASIAQQTLQFVLNQHFEDEPFEETEQQQQQHQHINVHIGPEVQNNGSVPEIEEKNLLWPVLPGESGEGLPYAPIDWPYPGDFWRWRVGKRYTAAGYFQDRFLYPPKRLGKQCFGSQPAVANYIKTHFPDANIDAFFASFAWKIPVKVEAPLKELRAPIKDEKPAGQEENKPEEFTASGRKRRSSTLQPPKQAELPAPTPKRTKKATTKSSRTKENGEKPVSTRPKRTKQQTEPDETTPQSSTAKRKKTRHPANPAAPSGPAEEPVIEPIPEDFDNYLTSLDDILTQPLSLPQSPKNDHFAALSEMAEARSRLSSLLAMDFPSLILSKNVSELAQLASKLKTDPRLNARQLVKLKLIEDIPSFGQVFMENRDLISQVDEFFATLESKKREAANLKREYNELKEKTEQIQSQVDISEMAVKEIDEQIALLQARRAKLAKAIKGYKAAKEEVLVARAMVANAIPKVVQQIQLANGKRPELEVKKSNAMKRAAEILGKFAPLQGFRL